ncbi:MAG: polysaccharide deacetylase [Lachnospiraceae bacterium]|nr:polysaccharide deacetylase [Lachnospiraceae bacterium]
MDKWQERSLARRERRRRQLRIRIAAGGIGLILAVAALFAWIFSRSWETEKADSPVRIVTVISESEEESSSESLEIFSPAHSPDVRDVYALDPGNRDWNYKPQEEKTVYLTFDDGPSYITPMVLEVLEKYKVRATFFVTSQSPPDAHYILEAYQKGHTIGLHSSSHSFEIYASEESYYDDLRRIGEVVRDQIGYIPCFIRFIGGSSNEKSGNYSRGIMTLLSESVQEKGYQYWDWNGDLGDGTEVTAEQAVENALSAASGTIVLLAHDGPNKESTVEALPKIIEGFRERGYVFKPLTREATVIHHTVLN